LAKKEPYLSRVMESMSPHELASRFITPLETLAESAVDQIRVLSFVTERQWENFQKLGYMTPLWVCNDNPVPAGFREEAGWYYAGSDTPHMDSAPRDLKLWGERATNMTRAFILDPGLDPESKWSKDLHLMLAARMGYRVIVWNHEILDYATATMGFSEHARYSLPIYMGHVLRLALQPLLASGLSVSGSAEESHVAMTNVLSDVIFKAWNPFFLEVQVHDVLTVGQVQGTFVIDHPHD